MSVDSEDLGWWTISGECLLGMLRRVGAGESPDLVYMEGYVNSSRIDFSDDDGVEEEGR